MADAHQDADEKICPMCGETILAVAHFCRYCGEELEGEGSPAEKAWIRQEAELLVRERYDKSTAIQILVTGVFGCFAPILALYGTVFLLLRPYSFPYKGLAVAGTILHWLWTLIQVGAIGATMLASQYP